MGNESTVKSCKEEKKKDETTEDTEFENMLMIFKWTEILGKDELPKVVTGVS